MRCGYGYGYGLALRLPVVASGFSFADADPGALDAFPSPAAAYQLTSYTTLATSPAVLSSTLLPGAIRIDVLDDGRQGLLVEDAGTQLILSPRNPQDAAEWRIDDPSVLAPNNVDGPDGQHVATRVTLPGPDTYGAIQQVMDLSSGDSFALAAWAKPVVAGTSARLQILGGSTFTEVVSELRAGWQRIAVSTPYAGFGSATPFLLPFSEFAGPSQGSLDLWYDLPSFEARARASSYMPAPSGNRVPTRILVEDSTDAIGPGGTLRYRLDMIMLDGSADITTDRTHWILHDDAGATLGSLVFVASSKKLKATVNGVSVTLGTAMSWSPRDLLRIAADVGAVATTGSYAATAAGGTPGAPISLGTGDALDALPYTHAPICVLSDGGTAGTVVEGWLQRWPCWTRGGYSDAATTGTIWASSVGSGGGASRGDPCSVTSALTQAAAWTGGALTVQFLPGTYYRTTTLAITGAHSHAHPVTWQAADGPGTVILSGAYAVPAGTWALADVPNNIWTVTLPGTITAVADVMVNDARSYSARCPAAALPTIVNSSAIFASWLDGGVTWAALATPTDATIVGLWTWTTYHVRVKGAALAVITPADTDLALMQEPLNANQQPTSVLYAYGCHEWLITGDSPKNTWHFNAATNVLSVRPADGVDMTTAVIKVPQLAHVVTIVGTSADATAHDHVFKDLVIEGSGDLDPRSAGRMGISSGLRVVGTGPVVVSSGNGAVETQWAHRISFQGCEIRNAGDAGLKLRKGSQDIDGGDIYVHDCGGSCYQVGDSSTTTDAHPVDARDESTRISFTRATFRRAGQLWQQHSVGEWYFASFGRFQNVTFDGAPYSGSFTGDTGGLMDIGLNGYPIPGPVITQDSILRSVVFDACLYEACMTFTDGLLPGGLNDGSAGAYNNSKNVGLLYKRCVVRSTSTSDTIRGFYNDNGAFYAEGRENAILDTGNPTGINVYFQGASTPVAGRCTYIDVYAESGIAQGGDLSGGCSITGLQIGGTPPDWVASVIAEAGSGRS